MAIRNKYRDDIFYLYLVKKRTVSGNPIEFESQPIIFEGTKVEVNKSHFSPQNNTYIAKTTTVIRTQDQRANAVTKYARITKAKIPINTAEKRDFSTVDEIKSKPINTKGQRYRTIEYNELEITIV